MKVKRLLALAMASVLMLSSAQTTALEAYAAEIPVVEEQSTQDVTQSEADIQNDEVTGEADLDTTVNDASMQKDPEDEEFIQDDTASDAADEKSVTLDDAEEADDDAKASEDDAESEEITVTFDANGGVFENGETTSVVNVKKGEPLTTLPMNPEMGDGSLVFSGWYYDKEGISIVDLSTFAPEEEVTIYAGWTKEVENSSGIRGRVTDGPFLWRDGQGRLLCLWSSFSEDGYTQGLAESNNREITGHFRQLTPLFREDGGHGMLFRNKEGQTVLTLHRPNRHLEEHPVFIPVEI